MIVMSESYGMAELYSGIPSLIQYTPPCYAIGFRVVIVPSGGVKKEGVYLLPDAGAWEYNEG